MSNTGRKIVLVLKEVDENRSNTPTGNTKPNLLSDVDYIAPVDDLTSCPLSYALNCPNILTTFNLSSGFIAFEFSLDYATFKNPAVLTIDVQIEIPGDALSIVTNTFDLSTGFNYFSGKFDSLPDPSLYVLTIFMKNSSGTIIKTCP